MSIICKEVEHVAHLARIELMTGEKKKFEKELSAILTFVEKLNEVDTAGVEPMIGGTSLENIMRPDEVVDRDLEGKAAELIEVAPEKKNNFIKVKAVFG